VGLHQPILSDGPQQEQALSDRPRGVVAFDLDGTLLRGPTVCELLAEPLGRRAEMRRFEALSTEPEIAAARHEMARWYEGRTPAQLCAALEAARWAPGAREGVALLQANGVEVVIASITWGFAVEWLARRLGVARSLGTRLEPGGCVAHVWPRDKPRWLGGVLAALGVPRARVAAVGDSGSDTDLLAAAALPFFVGRGAVPRLRGLVHRPEGDIEQIAREVLAHWAEREIDHAEP
jgi:phosphoserine phosphatase